MYNYKKTPELLLGFYEMMVRLRIFEERATLMYKSGEIPGFLHVYNGEEAVATGVCAHLGKDDTLTSTHRGHGHALAKGCNSSKTMAELYGRVDGYSGGRGGSMHIYAPEHGLLGTNGIVGGGIALAVGAGLTYKTLGRKNVGVTIFGDGASNMGVFYESMNLAAIYNLPVVFVCENNLYATVTHISLAAANPEIATRAEAFRMPGIAVDGNDVMAVYEAMGEAAERAREGKGPTLIEAKTYRTQAHAVGDLIYGVYRTKEEVDEWVEKCPIVNFRKRLVKEFSISDESILEIDEKIKIEIDQAVEFSRQSKLPDPADVEKYVFAEV